MVGRGIGYQNSAPGVRYDLNMRPSETATPSLFWDGRAVPYESFAFALCVVTDYQVRIACVTASRRAMDHR